LYSLKNPIPNLRIVPEQKSAMTTKDDSIGSSRVTWEGCSVLLDINDGERLVFARLSPNA